MCQYQENKKEDITMSKNKDEYNINNMLRFSTEQDKVGEDLIVTTILLNGSPLFQYPAETGDSRAAETSTVNAFLYSLEQKYNYEQMRTPAPSDASENLFEELI